MSESYLSYISLVLAIILAQTFAFFPLYRKTKWYEEIKDRSWKIYASVASVFALVFPIVHFMGLPDLTDFWRVLASCISVGMISVVMVYAWTDIKVRKVDRRMLNIASLTTLVFNTAYLITHWDRGTAIAAGAMVLLGVIVYVFVPAIGASDARALILIGTGVVPIIGLMGFLNAMMLVCFLFILVGAGMTIYKRQINPEVSFPVVPILVSPFWVLMIFSSYWGMTPNFV